MCAPCREMAPDSHAVRRLSLASSLLSSIDGRGHFICRLVGRSLRVVSLGGRLIIQPAIIIRRAVDDSWQKALTYILTRHNSDAIPSQFDLTSFSVLANHGRHLKWVDTKCRNDSSLSFICDVIACVSWRHNVGRVTIWWRHYSGYVQILLAEFCFTCFWCPMIWNIATQKLRGVRGNKKEAGGNSSRRKEATPQRF